jgi:hypothetical protein
MTVPLPPMPPPQLSIYVWLRPARREYTGRHAHCELHRSRSLSGLLRCQQQICMAWNFVVRTDSTTACVLKQHGFRSPSCTSGIKPTPGAVGGLWTIGFRASAPAQLLHATAWGMAGIRTSPAVLMD